MSRIRDSSWSRALGRWLPAMACLLAVGHVPCQEVSGTRPNPVRIGVFFWHDSPNDRLAFAGIKAALAMSAPRCELVVKQAGENPELAARILVGFRSQGCDLILAMGTEAALHAAKQVSDVPIVFTAVTNPVESGVVPSWKGSGRNLAGNSNWIAPQIVLRVFRLAVPRLRRLGMLRTNKGVVAAAELRSMQAYLERHPETGIEIIEERVDAEEKLEPGLERLVSKGVEAIWIPIDRLVYQNTPRLFRAARRHKVPLVSSSLQGTRSGATAGVVVDYRMLGKRAGALAQRVLSGRASPGDVPVGTMTGYRVVVNIEAARQSGYELPLSALLLADVLLEKVEKNGPHPSRKK